MNKAEWESAVRDAGKEQESAIYALAQFCLCNRSEIGYALLKTEYDELAEELEEGLNRWNEAASTIQQLARRIPEELQG